MDPSRCGPDPGERVSVEGGALEPGSGRCTVDPARSWTRTRTTRRGSRTLGVRSRVACGQVHRVWITGSSGSRSLLVTAAPGGSAPPRSGPPLGPVTAARAQSPRRARRYMHRRGPRPGSLPDRASPGDPRLGPLPPAGVPSPQPARHPGRRCRWCGRRGRRRRPDPPQGSWGRTPRPVRRRAVPMSRFADPHRRRPLDGVRLAPVTCGAAQQRGPPGCSPVPGEASLVREATVGRRFPDRSMGGLSAGTIQVPAGGTGRLRRAMGDVRPPG